jgi:hypothetical protein
MPSIHLPFLFHIIVEFPASVGFFLRPSATLVVPQPHAHAVIRQYALLLASTNLVAGAFLFNPSSPSSAQVAGALALYHVGPLMRAWNRIRAEERTKCEQGDWRGPWLHLGVHGICTAALMGEAFQLW